MKSVMTGASDEMMQAHQCPLFNRFKGVLYSSKQSHNALLAKNILDLGAYFLYLRDYVKNKFTPKLYHCVFFGYSPMHKGYRCLHPPSKIVYLSRHVIFDE